MYDKPYVKIDKISIFHNWYMYMDHKSYALDELFVRNRLHLKFSKEYQKADTPWVIITIRIPKSESDRFEKVMFEAKNFILLKGYRDYANAYNDIWVNGIVSKLNI